MKSPARRDPVRGLVLVEKSGHEWVVRVRVPGIPKGFKGYTGIAWYSNRETAEDVAEAIRKAIRFAIERDRRAR